MAFLEDIEADQEDILEIHASLESTKREMQAVLARFETFKSLPKKAA